MSDLSIIGIIVLVMFIAVIRVGWLAGRKLSEPRRRHGRADKNIEKIVEDRVNAILARKGIR